MNNGEQWMRRAYELAVKARDNDEVPVGAVIVLDDRIIGEGWNQPISSNDPTAHAEVIALKQAGKHINNYRLPGATMYVTLEPCAMCAGALVHARLAKLVYATDEPKSGACGSVLDITRHDALNHNVEIECGTMQDECRKLLQDFFQQKRIK